VPRDESGDKVGASAYNVIMMEIYKREQCPCTASKI